MIAIYNKIQLKMARMAAINSLRSNSRVNIGENFKLGDFVQFTLNENIDSLIIGSGVDLKSSFSCVMGEGAKLNIGDNICMNKYCSVNCLESISIGENSLIGEGVKFYDHNHAIKTEPEFKVEAREFTTAPISIGKNCWLGCNVVILKGVTIGDNSIIGAGCVIHKDIPEGSKIVNSQNLINLNESKN